MRETQFPESSLAEDWTGTITFTEDSDGSAVDLSDFTEITMKAWDENDCPALEGTLTGGEIVLTTDYIMEFTFPVASVGGLKTDRYSIGITASDGTSTRQLLRGAVTFYDGMNNGN